MANEAKWCPDFGVFCPMVSERNNGQDNGQACNIRECIEYRKRYFEKRPGEIGKIRCPECGEEMTNPDIKYHIMHLYDEHFGSKILDAILELLDWKVTQKPPAVPEPPINNSGS